MRFKRTHLPNRRRAVGDDGHPMAVGFQRTTEAEGQIGIVFDNQNARRRANLQMGNMS